MSLHAHDTLSLQSPLVAGHDAKCRRGRGGRSVRLAAVAVPGHTRWRTRETARQPGLARRCDRSQIARHWPIPTRDRSWMPCNAIWCSCWSGKDGIGRRGTQSASGGQSSNNYFGPHQPDKWDRLPLILVDDPELRTALGIKKGQKYISPFDLSQAQGRSPGHSRRTPVRAVD